MLILLITLASFFRLWQIDSESLRLDEAQSIWQASHTFTFIKTHMVQNVHLPLHNSILHIWQKYFGTSESSVRLMSAIPGILTVVVFYFLAKEVLIKPKYAFFATFLAAVSPFWVWYSREIRMYTLLTLVTVCSYLFFIRFIKRMNTFDAILYFVANAVGVYTHYFFLLVIAVQVIFLLFFWHKNLTPQSKAAFHKVLYALMSIGAFLYIVLLPWLHLFYLEHNSQSGTFAPNLARPNGFNVFLSLFEFTFGYQPEGVTTALLALWPLVTLLSFIFLIKRPKPHLPFMSLVIIGAIIPVIGPFLVSVFVKPIYLTRYLITATPFYLLLISWFLLNLGKKARAIIIPLYFVLIGFSLFNQFESSEVPTKENYRGAAVFVSKNATPRDVVVLSPPYTLYPIYYYYTGLAKVRTLPLWTMEPGPIPHIQDATLEQDFTRIKANHQRVFLVATLNLEDSQKAKDYLDSNYKKLASYQFSKFIWVYVYQVGYPAKDTYIVTSVP